MKNTKKRKKKLLFWLIIFFFFGAVFVRQQIVINNLNKEYRGYKEQMDKLSQRKADLNEKYKLTQREDYVEKLAREKLGLIKPGEILFVDKNKVK